MIREKCALRERMSMMMRSRGVEEQKAQEDAEERRVVKGEVDNLGGGGRPEVRVELQARAGHHGRVRRGALEESHRDSTYT